MCESADPPSSSSSTRPISLYFLFGISSSSFIHHPPESGLFSPLTSHLPLPKTPCHGEKWGIVFISRPRRKGTAREQKKYENRNAHNRQKPKICRGCTFEKETGFSFSAWKNTLYFPPIRAAEKIPPLRKNLDVKSISWRIPLLLYCWHPSSILCDPHPLTVPSRNNIPSRHFDEGGGTN